MNEWYYQRGQASYGPIQAAQLIALRDRGSLKPATLVRQDGSNIWLPLSEVNFEPMEANASRSASAAAPLPEKRSMMEGDSTLAELYAPPASTIRVPERPPHLLKISVALLVVALLGQIAENLATVLFSSLALIGLEVVPERLDFLVDSIDEVWPLISSSSNWRQIAFLMLLILWQGCAFSSLRQLYGDDIMEHGPASGLWWVIPFANLFMPLLCMRELRHLSKKRRHVFQVGAPFGAALWIMHAGMVTGISLKVVLFLRYKSSALIWVNGQMDATTLLIELLQYSAWLIYFVLLTCVVVGNLSQQRQLFRDECAR